MTVVAMIWAQSSAGVLGRDNQLPWRIPEDAKRFRELTTGHPVIMGRRTWESLPARFRPLPGRRNLVLTRQPGLRLPGAEVVGSLTEAIEQIEAIEQVTAGTVWIVGGAPVYAEAAQGLATVAEVTEVDIDVSGDTFAPSLTGWTRESVGDWQTSTTGLRYRYLRYTRRTT